MTLVVLGAVLLLVGSVTWYARTQIVDEDAFADRAVAALEDDQVRRVVSREIVVNLIDRGSSELVAARPLLESVVDAVIQSAPFQTVFRQAARQTNRLFFVRERRSVLLDLADAAQLVRFALRSVSPAVARELPKDLDAELVALRRREFAGRTLAIADDVRVFGVVLPLLALGAFLGAVAIAPDRRIAVLRAGVGVGASAALLAIVLLLLRARILAGVVGEDELTDEDVRGAVAGLLDAFAGDLVAGSLLLALGGLVIGAAAAALDPEDVGRPLERLRNRLSRPETTLVRAARGAAAVVLGVFVVLSPQLALEVAAIGAGALLVFFGTSELLVLLQRPGVEAAEHRSSRRRALVVAGVAGSLCAAAVVAMALVLTSGDEEAARAEAAPTRSGECNGSVSLCELPLNEVVFAGTHNSFSAADSPGWFIANQRRTIERQLRDGIRLFLIDAHWGVRDEERGRVRTDFATERRDRNKVVKTLPPNLLKAAERLAGRVGAGDLEGERRVFLCHTVCEIGATDMVESLEGMRRFLEENRGELVVLFVEPYVAPEDLVEVFERSGLDRYLAVLERNEPLPTLGSLVRRNRRVVVLAEKDADGSVPWYLDGFSFVQDTPLGATMVGELSCKLSRGDADSPLLMLNHWADLFPPRVTANVPFLRERTLLDRARRCGRERGLPVSLIAVDHYEQGELVGAVATLNAERVQAFRRRQRVGG